MAFSLPKNQKQAVNQLGMTNETVPNLEQISDDLQKRAEENYYKNQFFVVKDKQGRKVSKRFFELDYNNKIKWVYANEIPYHRIDVTEAHFEEAKNSKNYIIKVDGNYISKDDLKKYKASDFITFSYTPISKLAEMKEQSVLNLVTTDAYNLFVRLMISHYTEVFANYENEMALPENKRKTDIKELVSTYEFLDYNYKKFTSEILKQNQLIPPTPLSEDIIRQVHQSYLDIPNLYIDKDNNLFLNNKSTSLKTIQKDFNEITNYKKSELILKANGRRIHNDFINQIMVAIGDNLTNIEVSNGQAVIYNPNFKNKEVNQQKPVMWILVNRKGQLLVDDEVGTLESIKKKLKKLSKTKNSKGTVAIQFDSEAPEKTVNEVKSIVQKSGFEVFTIDTNPLPPPPPPPPAPETPKKTSKGGPNANGVNQTNKIERIEIYIDSDNNIQLNGKSIKEDVINNQVAKLNKHLSTDDHRKYVMASIAIEKNKSADLAKSIQTKLKKVNIFCGSISYLENVSKSNLPKKSLNLYSGLTVEEAKAKEKKIFSTSGDAKKKTDNTNDNSPWKVKMATASYEYTDDNGNSTGKIYLDQTKDTPPESTLDFVIRMAKEGAKFYNEGQPITSDKAIALIKKNNQLNVNAREKSKNGKPLVYITKKPIVIDTKVGKDNPKLQKSILPKVNGENISSPKLKMTKKEFKKLKLSTEKGKVNSFKVKIPGIETEFIEGNTITKTTISNIKNFKIENSVIVFDIKDEKGSNVAPLIIELTD